MMEKEYLSLTEIQNEELEILKRVVSLLEELNLTYYLFGGTLIGAVRHNGFIPWDDDIDIAMPRPDYEKFLDYAKENNCKLFENCVVKDFSLGNGIYPFGKVENLNIAIEQDIDIDKFLWIDIFPLDGLPNNKIRAKKHLKKLRLLRRIHAVMLMKTKNILKDKSKSKMNRFIKIIMRFFLQFMNKDKLCEKIIKMSQKYKYEDCQYIAHSTSTYGEREIYPKKNFKIRKVIFEDCYFNGIEGYDEILRITYGDYMELPPEDKRETHNMKVYRLR